MDPIHDAPIKIGTIRCRCRWITVLEWISCLIVIELLVHYGFLETSGWLGGGGAELLDLVVVVVLVTDTSHCWIHPCGLVFKMHNTDVIDAVFDNLLMRLIIWLDRHLILINKCWLLPSVNGRCRLVSREKLALLCLLQPVDQLLDNVIPLLNKLLICLIELIFLKKVNSLITLDRSLTELSFEVRNLIALSCNGVF